MEIGKRMGIWNGIFLAFLFFGSRSIAQGNDTLERVFTGSSLSTEVQTAKREVSEAAVLSLSEELVKDLIGEDRFLKNRHLLPAKIFKQSAKYILFSKTAEPEVLNPGPGYRISITMRLSVNNLKALLQKQGLLTESNLQQVILPLISVHDRVAGKNYKWWQSSEIPADQDLLRKANLLESSLRKNFRKGDFFVIAPSENQWGKIMPLALQGERMGPEEIQNLGLYYQAPIALTGALAYQKDEGTGNVRIEIHVTAVQVANAKTLAEVSRKYNVEGNNYAQGVEKKLKEVVDVVCSDLGAQIFEAWQRGSIGSSLVRVSFRGDFSILRREAIREKLATYVPQMRNVRERVIAADGFTLEAESNAAMRDLLTKIVSLDFEGKRPQVVTENEAELILRFP